MPFGTPVALLTFARPAETARVFDAIRQMRPRTLLVVSDGAREGRPDEAERVAQTRALLDTIDWDCDLRTNFAPTNMGCRRRVSSGLDWVFQQVDRAIILEDDCLPSPAFFQYCAEMLERYQDNPQVMTISGMTYFSGKHRIADSYHFSRYPLIWGWASWARAWRHYDVDMKDWPQQKADGLLRAVIGDRLIELQMEDMFDHVHGGFDTWDVQLLYASVKRGGLNVIPVTNMILNIGYGEFATHTTGGSAEGCAPDAAWRAVVSLDSSRLSAARFARGPQNRKRNADAPAFEAVARIFVDQSPSAAGFFLIQRYLGERRLEDPPHPPLADAKHDG